MKTFADVTAHLSRLAEICTAYRQDALDELTQTHGDEWGRIVSELLMVGPDRGRPVRFDRVKSPIPKDQPLEVFLEAVSEHAKEEERTRIFRAIRDVLCDQRGIE